MSRRTTMDQHLLQEIFDNQPCPATVVTFTPRRRCVRVLSGQDKYRRVHLVTQQIARAVSDMSTVQFHHHLSQLEKFARNTTLQKWLRAVVYCLIYLLTHWFLLNLNITNLFLSILISKIKKTVLNKFSNIFCHYFLLITACRTQINIVFKIYNIFFRKWRNTSRDPRSYRRNAISRKWPTDGISGCYPWDGTTRHYTGNCISKTVHCSTNIWKRQVMNLFFSNPICITFLSMSKYTVWHLL